MAPVVNFVKDAFKICVLDFDNWENEGGPGKVETEDGQGVIHTFGYLADQVQCTSRFETQNVWLSFPWKLDKNGLKTTDSGGYCTWKKVELKNYNYLPVVQR